MYRYVMTLVLFVLGCWAGTCGQVVYPQPRKFPSIRVGIAIPGGWTAATDQEAASILISQYGANTGDTVRLWETDHCDMVSGGDFGLFSLNTKAACTVYIQIQNWDSTRGPLKYARINSLDPEDFFLHFKEDTILNYKSINSTAAWWNGWFETVAWGTSWNDASNLVTSSPPWNLTALQYGPNGGGIYLVAGVPFVEMTIQFTTPGQGDGTFVVEYCSQVDENDVCTQWSSATIISDGTNGLKQDGTIRWSLPSNWKWCNFSTRISSSYAVRLRAMNYTTYPVVASIRPRQFLQIVTGIRSSAVVSASANKVKLEGKYYTPTDNYYKDMIVRVVSGPGQGQTRTVVSSWREELTVSPDWETIPTTESRVEVEGPALKIPGWDPANDRNGDGYVDDSEFSDLVNPNATARMRWESRVVVTNYPNATARHRANLWQSHHVSYWVWYLSGLKQSKNIAGFHNDNVFDVMGWGVFPVLQGGTVWEYPGQVPGKVHEDPLVTDYIDTYAEAYRLIGQGSEMSWVGGNIANTNLFARGYLGRKLLDYFTWVDCEDSFYDSTTIYSFFRQWRFPAHAYKNVTSLIYGHVKAGVVEKVGNTEAMWKLALQNILCQMYLIQVPERTVALFWNRTFSYGSGLTTVAYYSFWKAGVPRNMAYIPVGLLSVDIGSPANTIPDGYEPIMYMDDIYINGVYKNYYPIGTSVDTSFYIGDWAGTPDGRVGAVPTYTFYLYRQGTGMSRNGYTWPAEAVIARKYTKGLVVLRMPFWSPADWPAYVNSTLTVPLPGTYRRVNWDGTLGPPITEITLGGFEGAVLVDAAQTNVPNIQLTVSVDKPNPKPLEVVTVTVRVQNVGNHDPGCFEIKVPLYDLVYEQRSAQGTHLVQTEVETQRNLVLTLSGLPAGESTIITFRCIVP